MIDIWKIYWLCALRAQVKSPPPGAAELPSTEDGSARERACNRLM